MLQSQEINYSDYNQVNHLENNDSSDGIGSSLASSPAPSLAESTSSSASNSSSPSKFAYSTPYTHLPNQRSHLVKQSNEYLLSQQQQQQQQQFQQQNFTQQSNNYFNYQYQHAYNKYYPNVFSQQQSFAQYNKSLTSEYPNQSFNDSCYQSRNNSFNYSTDSVEIKPSRPVINSLNKFSIDAILAKPNNVKQANLLIHKQENITEKPIIKEKAKRKKRGANANDLDMSSSNKRIRTIFTQEQLDKLEVEFLKQQYMVGSERTYLANALNLSESQVKIWFQNRRIKWRRTTAEEQQTEREAHSKKMNSQHDEEDINESEAHSNNTSTCSYDDEEII